MAVNRLPVPAPADAPTLAGWVADIVGDPNPVAVADAAAAIGALLVLGTPSNHPDYKVRTALRSARDWPVPLDACCSAAFSAGGLAALGELLAGHDDARRAVANLPSDIGRPLDERLIAALSQHGPMRRADLVRALDAPPTTVTRALARLRGRGMVQTVSTSPGIHSSGGKRQTVVTYALTSAGTAVGSLR